MSKICLVSLIFLNLRAGDFDKIDWPDVTSHLDWLNWPGDHPKTTRAVGLLLAGTVAGKSPSFRTDPALKTLTRRVVTDATQDFTDAAKQAPGLVDKAWQVTKEQAPVYATKALDLACEYPVWTGFGVGVAVASAAIATGSSKGKSIVGATIPGGIAYLVADTRGVRQLASEVRSGAADVAVEAVMIKDQTTQNAARSEKLTILQTAIAESLAVTADTTRRVVDESSRLAPRIEAVGKSIGASADATTGASAALGSLAAEIQEVGSAAKAAAATLKELERNKKEYSARRQVGHASVLAGLCGLQRRDEEGWQALDAAHIKEVTALADLSSQVYAGRALLQSGPRAGSSV